MTVDLTTQYLGLELKNPLMASSSPLTGEIESLLRLQDAGISGVVLPSLFEEQIEHEAIEVSKLMEYGAHVLSDDNIDFVLEALPQRNDSGVSVAF